MCEKPRKGPFLSCHSARVDPEFGRDSEGQLDNLEQPFRTIDYTIKIIIKKGNPGLKNRWIIFLAPCTFKENVKLYPFIDLHGEDRLGSIIQGNLDASLIAKATDQVEIKELSTLGKIIKKSGLGLVSLFDVTAQTCSRKLFNFESGELRADSCTFTQLLNKNQTAAFYKFSGIQTLNVTIRNCRHVRDVNVQILPGVKLSNFLVSSLGFEATSKANIFINNFNQPFSGVLIPYNLELAAGSLNAHSDTFRQAFKAGIGIPGVVTPVPGLTYSTAFILLRKISAPGMSLEAHVHTADVIGLPEGQLSTFASVHTATSGRAKTKHTAWQGYIETPESLIVGPGTDITVDPVNFSQPERSIIGAASDVKLFVGRSIYQRQKIITVSAQVNSDAGIVDILSNQLNPLTFQTISEPISANWVAGDQITVRLPTPVLALIQAVNGTPPLNSITKIGVTDVSLDATRSYPVILYTSLPIAPPPILTPGYPNNLPPVIFNVAQIQFTLDELVALPPISLVWSGVTTHKQMNTPTNQGNIRSFFTPGTYSFPMPSGFTSMTILAWGAGGGGGNSSLNILTLNTASAGGGGSGAGFIYTPDISPLGAATVVVVVGTGGGLQQNGGDTQVAFYVNNIAVQSSIAHGGSTGADGDPSLNSLAEGGSGGGVEFLNPLPQPPPSTMQIFAGTNGGNSSIVVNAFTTGPGDDGQASTTGYLGGKGGNIVQGTGDPAHFVLMSAPGGGAGGFNGVGSSAGTFAINSEVVILNIWEAVGNGSPTPPNSGAGGAGQGPRNVDVIGSGGNGGVVIFFQ